MGVDGEARGLFYREVEISDPVPLSEYELKWITPKVYDRYLNLCERFVQLQREVQESGIVDFVQFDPLNLEEEVAKHPSAMYYVVSLMVKAKFLQSLFEHLLDVVQAKLDAMYRAMAEEGGNKVTEAKVRSMVVGHPLYDDVQVRQLAVGYLVGRISAVRDALSSKKEMIITYAVNLRDEREIDALGMKKGEMAGV
jgi:hypothetical protein